MTEPDGMTATLDEWLSTVLGLGPLPETYITYQFPTQAQFDEYIARIASVPESEILALLRLFLMPSACLGLDRIRYENLALIKQEAPEDYAKMMRLTHYKRLKAYFEKRRSPPPWEGITWVLDLLPHWPADALRALDSYFLAHAQFLPDGRLNGLSDSMALIRAWYIGTPGTQAERLDLLKALSPRHFEHVVHELYTHMGYRAVLTPARKDGGRDIIASRAGAGVTESLRVECKRWHAPIGVEIPRQLLGVVSSEKANKGAVVTCGRFTSVARAFAEGNPRVELVSGEALVPMLNEFLGSSWPTRLDSIILESRSSETCAV